jgi:hypothetical protein
MKNTRRFAFFSIQKHLKLSICSSQIGKQYLIANSYLIISNISMILLKFHIKVQLFIK